jgi:hypothetical protein
VVDGVAARARVVLVVPWAVAFGAGVVVVAVVGAGVAPEDVAAPTAMPTPRAPATPTLSEATITRLRAAGWGL